MNADFVEFRRGVVSPMECIQEGWALIKDEYWLFFGISIVGFLIGSAFTILLMGPMMIGVFLCLQQRQRTQAVEFGTLFKGFDSFVQGLVVTALKLVPSFVIVVPYWIFLAAVMILSMQHGRINSPDDMHRVMSAVFPLEILFYFLMMIVTLLVEIFFMLAYPLIADRQVSGLEAVKLSFRAAKANFGGILVLMLLNGIFGFLGLLCCLVGFVFYMPVAFASQAVAYRRIFPDIGTIGTNSPFPPPPPGTWA